MRVGPDPPWVPKTVTYRAGQPIVELARLAPDLPRFFSDLDVEAAGVSVQVPLMSITFDRAVPLAAPRGFVFHLPRSGSTLVARMLTCAPGTSCLIEPEVFHALLAPPRGVPADVRWLRQLGRIYAVAFAGRAEALFVKLASWCVLKAELIAGAWPDVAACFVHRDPTEVVAQLLQRPVAWMAPAAGAAVLGQPRGDMPVDEFCARVVGRLCDAAAEAQHVRPLAYERIHAELADVAVATFGLTVGPAERRAMERIAEIDSEDWSGRRRYDPRRDDSLTAAPEALRAVVAAHTHGARERLLSAAAPGRSS